MFESLSVISRFTSATKLRRCVCAAAAIFALSTAGLARAESLEDQVLNYAGPTYAAAPFSLALTSTDLSITGTPEGLFSPTEVVDPNNNDYSGTFTLNIDLTGAVTTSTSPFPGVTLYDTTLANTQNDFLTEQIYIGPTLTTVFASAQGTTQTVGLGAISAFGTTEIWFAFEQLNTTFAGKAGDIIGGYFNYNNPSDVKTFDTSMVPAPSAALGGLVLMAMLGAKGMARRLLNRRLLPLKARA